MPVRILLAEDDHWVRTVLEDTFRRAGYEVVGVARNGREAVELAEALAPDLIVMDIRMPEMDGLEAARRINERRFTPIVVLTAYADQTFLQRAKEARVLGYLLKPADGEELVSALEVALSVGREIAALEGEIQDLRERLETRKLVERAKGLAMEVYGMTEREAMRFLQKEATRRRVKLKVVAQMVIELLEKVLESRK